jgi:hypothetical protein
MWLNLELHMPSSYRHMGQRCLNERCGQYGRNVLGSRANRRSFDCAVLTPGFAQDDNFKGWRYYARQMRGFFPFAGSGVRITISWGAGSVGA